MNRDTEALNNNAAQYCSALQHRSVAFFEDAPCYPIEKLVKLHGMRKNMLEEKEEAKQLELAKELELPVIIHDRDAHQDTMELLRKHRPRGIVHCYSGSAEMALRGVFRRAAQAGPGASV